MLTYLMKVIKKEELKQTKKGMLKIFGWFLFLLGAVFIANSFFKLTDIIPKEIGAFIGLVFEVLGFFLIVAKFHDI